MCGDTSLGAPVQNIVDRLRDLATVDPDTNQTLFEKQFKVLLLYKLTVICYGYIHRCLILMFCKKGSLLTLMPQLQRTP